MSTNKTNLTNLHKMLKSQKILIEQLENSLDDEKYNDEAILKIKEELTKEKNILSTIQANIASVEQQTNNENEEPYTKEELIKEKSILLAMQANIASAEQKINKQHLIEHGNILTVELKNLYHTTAIYEENNPKSVEYFYNLKKDLDDDYTMPANNKFSEDLEHKKFFTLSEDVSYADEYTGINWVFLRYYTKDNTSLKLLDARNENGQKWLCVDGVVEFLEEMGVDGYLRYEDHMELCIFKPYKFIRSDKYTEIMSIPLGSTDFNKNFKKVRNIIRDTEIMIQYSTKKIKSINSIKEYQENLQFLLNGFCCNRYKDYIDDDIENEILKEAHEIVTEQIPEMKFDEEFKCYHVPGYEFLTGNLTWTNGFLEGIRNLQLANSKPNNKPLLESESESEEFLKWMDYLRTLDLVLPSKYSQSSAKVLTQQDLIKASKSGYIKY